MTTDHTNDETPEPTPAREPEIGECEWPADPPPGCEVFSGGRTWYARVHGFLLAASARSRRDAVVDAWNCVTNFGDNPLPRIHPPGQPTEPPPLPAGWTACSLEGTSVRGAMRRTVDVWYDPTEDNVQVDESGTRMSLVPAAVLRHLLGLTAPAADVRALESACKALLAEVYVGDGNIVCPPALVKHIRAITDALTGKGAPL